MSKIGTWSTTAGNNNATPPNGWPEGQAPSTVNDCAREMMAAIKTAFNTLEYVDLNNTPSFLTTTTFSLGAADVANWEVGRRVKLFDATTLYGVITSVSGTFVQVRLDSGLLTASLSSAALAVIRNTNNSLPDAAFQQQNVIFNAKFDVWNRTASIAAASGGTYAADRFRYEAVNGATVNMYRSERSATSTNVPSLQSAGVFLNNSLTMYISTGAALAAGDYAMLTYTVEGFDWRNVAHQPCALSFQVKTNKSGIYCVALRNSASSVSFVQNYTVSAVNTWQRVFMTFPEAPTTPYTWDYSAGAGLHISWTLAGGATYQATGSVWTAMNAIATSSQVNFLADAGNNFSITDLRFKVGHADVPTIHRPAAAEFDACRRYYWKGLPCTHFRTDAAGAGSIATWPVQWPTAMRVTPSVSYSLSGASWNFLDSAQTTFSGATPFGAVFKVVSPAAGIDNSVTFGASDFMVANAEIV